MRASGETPTWTRDVSRLRQELGDFGGQVALVLVTLGLASFRVSVR